ncbi:MAG: J domain-containing protein [Lachnospiraceae bacterium]|nr:J domain-containing protein [Lachnospiraceae bacterium]
MNGLKVVKVAELRAKLAAIPAKLLLAVLAVGVLFWDTDLEKTFAKISDNPAYAVVRFLVIYGVLSYLYFFIKIFHNYLIGILVAAAVAYALYTIKGNFTGNIRNIFWGIMIFGGPVLDLLRFVRYRNMKREVIEESEEYKDKIDDIYDNVHGYDEGYDAGYERGYSRGRNETIDWYERERIESSGYDEEYDDDDYIEEKERMPELPTGFFEGCKSPEAIKRRYRDLCKVYHPDNGNGSEAIFNAICDEYNRLMDE